jgi:hypothetical protein
LFVFFKFIKVKKNEIKITKYTTNKNMAEVNKIIENLKSKINEIINNKITDEKIQEDIRQHESCLHDNSKDCLWFPSGQSIKVDFHSLYHNELTYGDENGDYLENLLIDENINFELENEYNFCNFHKIQGYNSREIIVDGNYYCVNINYIIHPYNEIILNMQYFHNNALHDTYENMGTNFKKTYEKFKQFYYINITVNIEYDKNKNLTKNSVIVNQFKKWYEDNFQSNIKRRIEQDIIERDNDLNKEEVQLMFNNINEKLKTFKQNYNKEIVKHVATTFMPNILLNYKWENFKTNSGNNYAINIIVNNNLELTLYINH